MIWECETRNKKTGGTAEAVPREVNNPDYCRRGLHGSRDREGNRRRRAAVAGLESAREAAKFQGAMCDGSFSMESRILNAGGRLSG